MDVKNLFLLVSITVLSFNFIYGQDYIFIEDFDDNDNGWKVTDDWNRKSEISNGLLIDGFWEHGFNALNIIKPDFDQSINHFISVKFANLNNDDRYSYNTYKMKKDGSTKKVEKIKRPHLTFVFGFKDGKNYHGVTFKNSPSDVYSYGRKLKAYVFSVSNGVVTYESNWTSVNSYYLSDGVGYGTISVIKEQKSYTVRTGVHSYSDKINSIINNELIGVIPTNSNDYGGSFGFIIPAGGKLGVDYIYVQKENLENKIEISSSKFDIPFGTIKVLVGLVDSAMDSASVYVETNAEGKRNIVIDVNSLDGLENELRLYSEQISILVFRYAFAILNESLENPISHSDLIHGFLSKGIVGFKVKSINKAYFLKWSELDF